MQEELSEFIRNNVWLLVPRPRKRTVIGSKWFFKTSLMRLALSLAIRLDLLLRVTNRKRALTMMKTFALMARLEAIRLFLAYAAHKSFKVFQMDIKNAFMNGKLSEEAILNGAGRGVGTGGNTAVVNQYGIGRGPNQYPGAEWYGIGTGKSV
ncbi:hypothetical protein OSB04_003041 [Centaurea solstitialis]|uniref:Reverse transcriptase Ty1/copia-type domain-containing protein n=1 Tax=Centaurea solstitialis TaxID=347529 RepID=A0AA38TU38_9ASTR|nr:hypothetical protein OSB04_003041 [Centaurea solstitialis]